MNIVICDDQQEYIDCLIELVKKNLPEEICCEILTFNSGEAFLASLNDNITADIIFMDIEMNGLSGIETVKLLNEKHLNSIVFFVTSHNEYVSELFRIKAFQFIQKPIDEQNFILDFNRAIMSYQNSHKKILVKQEYDDILIEYGSIKYIDINHKTITIHTTDGNFSHYGKLDYYLNELIPRGFARTHKSYLINLDYVFRVNTESIKVCDSDEYIPLSRAYKDEFLNRYRKYCLGKCI